MVRVRVYGDKGALPHADPAQVLLIHLRLDPHLREICDSENLSTWIHRIPRGRLRSCYHSRERRFQRREKCSARIAIRDSEPAEPLTYAFNQGLLRTNVRFDPVPLRLA